MVTRPVPDVGTVTLPVPGVVADRTDALRDAVASRRLEGLDPSRFVIAALQRVVRGEITIEEVIVDIHARIARDEV